MPIGTIGGRPAQIQVTVPLSVLLPPEVLSDGCTGDNQWVARLQGDSSAQDHPPPSDMPDEDELSDIPQGWYRGPGPAEVAELTGYGPISPDVALALAYAGGTWQRLVTDPLSGALLDVGRKQYRPPAAIADFVRLRDGTCVRPGCSVPARGCQADHIVPWSFGGITSVDTMACLCPRDHVLKTTGVSLIQREDTGAIVWTSPTGHRYRRDHTGHITPLPASAIQAAAQAARNQSFADEPPF